MEKKVAEKWREIASFLESLEVQQGRLAGKKIVLFPWQKRFLKGAFSQDDDAALSIARGNGKSTFMAGVGLAALVGPLAQRMAECVIVASSFDQGKIVFRHLKGFGDPWFEAEKARYKIRDSDNAAEIEDRQTKSRVKVIGSDPRRAHGLAPALLILDEVAQWPPNSVERMVSALETSRGKIPDSRAIWIGTRPDSPDHIFQRTLDDPDVFSMSFDAHKDDPPFQKKTWAKANPSLSRMPDLEKVIRREAKRAKRDPQLLASFRALRLNQGVSDVLEKVLLTAETWREIEVEEITLESSEYVLGVDLGTSAAMSAVAAYWPDTGSLDAFACFPHEPDLQQRGLSDGVDNLYVQCAERGDLIQAGGLVSDVGALLREVIRRWGNPSAIVCDRWRLAELKQNLVSSQIPFCPLIERGQGFKDGGEDVRQFRNACLDGKVRVKKSLLMRSAIASARVTTDPAGNSKLAKGGLGRRLKARDDAVAAAILAVSFGVRLPRESRPEFDYAIA